MGFKNMKRDDHGHVISNDETDGQKCQHASGQADKVEDQKYNKEMKEAQEQNAAMSESFDDDYEEEFNEPDEAKIKKMISEKFNKTNNDIKYDKEDAEKFKNAGFDVASEEEVNEIFGKDTPERKLAGAIKGQPNKDALYRPDEDKGPRESKGPADPNAPAGQVLYNSDEEEFLKDVGSEVKGSQFGRPETLDEYFERVKNIHANNDEEEFNDWTYFVSQAFGIGKKNARRYLELKLKSLPKKSENLDGSQGLDKLGISQGFGKRVSKNQFEEYVKLSDEDKQKLRKQGFLQNYHGYDIEEVDGKDEYRIWKLGK